jgi:hypothetical protein
MNSIRDFRNKSPNEILAINIELDSATYFFIAACWIDHFKRSGRFESILNCSIHARMGIEYLLFEEIMLTSKEPFTEKEYSELLDNKGKLEARIKRLQPEYEKLKEFTGILASLESGIPSLVRWDLKKLMKYWGVLSSFLHWHGASIRTSQDNEWLREAGVKVEEIAISLWNTKTSGSSGIMKPDSMNKKTKDVWDKFSTGEIDADTAKLRLKLYFPNTK